MKRRFSLVVLSAIVLFFAACSEEESPIESVIPESEEIKSTEITAVLGDSTAFTEVLTEAEVAGLLEMREEEKLARDVYIYFYQMYDYIVFNIISKSEDAHARSVAYLLDGFGLADPAPEEIGEFSAALFNTLYADLTTQGSTSLVDALKTGAFIEEYDIADLKRLLDETTNTAIQRVYGNLLRGSTFHLRAYSAALNRLGEKYTPTVISEEEYQDLITVSDDDDNDESEEGTFVPGTGVCDGTCPDF